MAVGRGGLLGRVAPFTGCSAWGHTESNMTEQLTLSQVFKEECK